MKKEKNTFEDLVIKIDDIIVKIDEETKQYTFAVKRYFNNFPIWVDLNNDRLPANREYRKLVKITLERDQHGLTVKHRTPNDKLRLSKTAIGIIEEATGIAQDDVVLSLKVADIRRLQNRLNAAECTNEEVRAEAKKALQPTDPISVTVTAIGKGVVKGVKKGGELVKNFLEAMGNNGDTSKNLSLPEIAKRESADNVVPCEQSKVPGLDNLTSTDYNTENPSDSNGSESDGM